jgi:hypothetical protein
MDSGKETGNKRSEDVNRNHEDDPKARSSRRFTRMTGRAPPQEWYLEVEREIDDEYESMYGDLNGIFENATKIMEHGFHIYFEKLKKEAKVRAIRSVKRELQLIAEYEKQKSL